MSTTTEVICSANDLLAAHTALISQVRSSQHFHRRQLQALHSPPLELLNLPLIPSPPASPTLTDSPPPSPSPKARHHLQQQQRTDLPPNKRARVVRYRNYVPEEETIRNDYSQRYVDGGEWPQNWVLGTELEQRFQEYPKQRRLIELKRASVAQYALPPTYLLFSEFQSLQPCKFDVILLDPPFSSSFTWDNLQELPLPSLAADPSFVFMWVGSGAGEGLERGREVLAKWGYRRCEDVVWVKTNKTTNRGPGTDPPTTSLLTRTKQHCLIGIRGTVRRSTDSWFVHCNVDTDVIIWEGDPTDPNRKPPEMFNLIENFCLGTRRLEVFGRSPTSFRRGWVTVLAPGQEERLIPSPSGSDLMYVDGEDGAQATHWDKEKWERGIQELASGGKCVVPMTPEIDALRPKSPFRPGTSGTSGAPGGSAVGMGANLGRLMTGGGNRVGLNASMPPGQSGQGQMMAPQPMVGMNNLGIGGMGINSGLGIGVGVDEMMGWQMGMGSMNMGGLGTMNPGTMGNVGVVGLGGMGLPFMNQMNQMAMGGAFQGQGGAFGSGVPVFNAGQVQGMTGPMGWGDQGQFGLEGGWDGDGMMSVGVGGMGTMNMGIGPGMDMGQWNSGNGYEGYR